MRDIAKGAEVSLGNLYNYYATKEAIFESMINGYVTVIDEQAQIDLRRDRRAARAGKSSAAGRDGREAGERAFGFLAADVHRRARISEPALPKDVRRHHGPVPKDICEKFEEAAERGDLRTGVDPALGVHGGIHAVF